MENGIWHWNLDRISKELTELYERKRKIIEELETLREINEKYKENVLPHLKRASSIIENNAKETASTALNLLEENYKSTSPESNVIKLKNDMITVKNSIEEEIREINEFQETVEANMAHIMELINTYEVEKTEVLIKINKAESDYNRYVNNIIN